MAFTTHNFTASAIDKNICGSCKRTQETHKCDVCEDSSKSVAVRYGNMLFCFDCWQKEEQASAEHQSPESQESRLAELAEKNRVETAALITARQLDSTIEVRTDVFNAKTAAILELKQAIENDASIENKPYALAEALMERFEHMKSVVFELQQKIVDAGNEQKAIQIYLNQMANTLRTEEREKLKIQNLNYKPNVVKVSKPKAVKTRAPKLDKAELRKYAAELGVPEFTLQMLVVSKGVTVETAANMLRRSIKEAQSIDDVPTQENQ